MIEKSTNLVAVPKEADRQLLRRLEAGIGVDAECRYAEFLGAPGFESDHVGYLTLPWLVIGTIDAYSSGSLRDRMSAVRYLRDLVGRLDAIDRDLRRLHNQWRMPEMLMALRYWSDESYLHNMPTH
jgi:hypothetical protein